MDDHEFYRQAVKSICGNLEIEEALYASLNFLRARMPVDRIFLQLQEVGLNALRIIAMTTPEKGVNVDLLTPLSAGALKAQKDMVDNYHRQEKANYIWLFTDNPKKHPVIREVFEHHNLDATSLMVLPLLATGSVLGGGSLVLTTEDVQKFTQGHADLISQLREPFTIAMSNALKHRNELKLRDKEFFWEATQRICGDLKIENAMVSFLNYIQKFIPVDRLFLQRYEKNPGLMLTIVDATPEEGKRIGVFTPLSSEAKEFLTKKYASGVPEAYYYDKPHEVAIGRELLTFHKQKKAASLLVLPLGTSAFLIGAVVLVSEESLYNDEHAELMSLLKEPFGVAMSNALQYSEIVKLKERLDDDNRYLHSELRRISGDDIVGSDYGLHEVMQQVRQVAPLNSPVLLLGETGTGKDVIANTIHRSSSRSSGPFISVNCGAIPDMLIDSELFGHEKGAFTGALTQKRGRFERADKGTIFLDEIGELPPQAQVRLLKVLQDREIERVGGTKVIPLDIRIIAATNRNLEEMVRNQEFREDLWFRLNVFPVHVPPLRERKADIPSLVQHFITLKSKEMNLPAIPTPSTDAIDLLMEYHWPGNVRELGNVIERAMILNPKGPLTFDHLNVSGTLRAVNSDRPGENTDNLDDMIADHIRNVLAKTQGKVNGPDGAAALLGVNPSTLRNRMKKMGINYGRRSGS